jgi:hypothetical protein
MEINLDFRIEAVENRSEEIHSAEHARLAGEECGSSGAVFGNGPESGDIAIGAVFPEGEVDEMEGLVVEGGHLSVPLGGARSGGGAHSRLPPANFPWVLYSFK